VTNAEYRCFVDDGGYEDEQWWRGEDALTWLRQGLPIQERIDYLRPRFKLVRERREAAFEDPMFNGYSAAVRELWLTRYANWSDDEIEDVLKSNFGGKKSSQPAQWLDSDFNRPSQPVVGISAYEAEAYARWLGARAGHHLRLPTEAEWEAAARVSAHARWPSGAAEPSARHFNHEPTRLRRTSPVGVFPGADTPSGLVDMVGNVWEWTASDYSATGHSAGALSQRIEGTQRLRVLRGGAWLYTARDCRVSFRGGYAPANRNNNTGFRLVRAAP
jgi:formylglycine-generating enzyme required for sulfatase activity